MKAAGRFVPLHEPAMIGNEWKYVKECIDTTWVSSGGPFVTRFENAFAQLVGSRHAVAVVNGTAALHLALHGIDIEAGDEVLVPTLTFIAPVNCVRYMGAIPRFVDAEEATFGMNPSRVAAFLEAHAELRDDGFCYNRASNRRIAACMPVHVFGHPVRLDELVRICDRFRIPIIEDATESLGTTYRERSTGTFGLIGCFSFNGNKIVTTGGGGMVVTNDAGIAEKIRHLSTQAKRDAHAYWHDAVGYNYRMPNINAALGCAQIEQLSRFVDKKRRIAAWYQEEFKGVSDLTFCWQPEFAKSNFWLNAIAAESADRIQAVSQRLRNSGFETRPPWVPCHLQGLFEPLAAGEISVAERLWKTCLNIPSSFSLEQEHVLRLVAALR